MSQLSPVIREAREFESRRHGGLLELGMIPGSTLGRWHMADRLEQPTVIRSAHPLQDRGFLGLQESNPVDTDVAYDGNPIRYGQPDDPMVGRRIGGVNVFGGGLAL